MKKNLVYVDAENLTVEMFHAFQELLSREIDRENEMVIGKFYGNHACLGEIVSLCYSAGYEFVDTIFISGNRKNVTDMKIVVDCMMDVMSMPNRDVGKIYLASSDHDFVPLVYKLRAQNCDIVLPFVEIVTERKTCADLSKLLQSKRFEAKVKERIFEKPFDLVREFADDEYSDELVSGYVSKKLRKIVVDVYDAYGGELSDEVAAITAEEFDFKKFRDVFIGTDVSDVDLCNLYTKKLFGVCLTRAIAEKKLEEVSEW